MGAAVVVDYDALIEIADWILNGDEDDEAPKTTFVTAGAQTIDGVRSFTMIMDEAQQLDGLFDGDPTTATYLGGCLVTEDLPQWMEQPLSEGDYFGVPVDHIVNLAKKEDVVIYREPKTKHLYIRLACNAARLFGVAGHFHVYTTRPAAVDA
jgi:hypothetical protein